MTEDYKVQSKAGYTSTVYHLPGNPPRVCKSFNKDCISTHFPVEKQVYERFSANAQRAPSSILKYYGVHDDLPAGLVLEYAAKGDLHNYIWDQLHVHRPQRRISSGAGLEEASKPKSKPKPGLKIEPESDTEPETEPETEPIAAGLYYRWAQQAAAALAFAHSLGIYNSDIHCVNFFLDANLNLKVGDWAGAVFVDTTTTTSTTSSGSVSGSSTSISYSSYRLDHRLTAADGTDVARSTGISVPTEIFALGTALYYMVTGRGPWPDLRDPEDREEIRRRAAAGEFPDTRGLVALGGVIRGCWGVRFGGMGEVRGAVEEEERAWREREGMGLDLGLGIGGGGESESEGEGESENGARVM